jgi:hypothetical protein
MSNSPFDEFIPPVADIASTDATNPVLFVDKPYNMLADAPICVSPSSSAVDVRSCVIPRAAFFAMSIVVGFAGAAIEREASTATTNERFLPEVDASHDSEYICGTALSSTDISLVPML